MKKLLGVALIAVLALAGCAPASTATFTDDQAQAILYGEVTRTSLGSLGLTPASNTIASDSVGAYLKGVGETDIEPAECANSARLLILADEDAESTDTFYALPNLTSGATTIAVKARLFGSDAAAQQFVADFQKANEGCPDFTATVNGSTDQVNVTVSEVSDDDEGFRLDTVAGVDGEVLTIRTYIVREGNLVIALQAPTNTDDDANLLIAASAAIYAQLTDGQSK